MVEGALLSAEGQLRAVVLQAGVRITLVANGELVQEVDLVHRVHAFQEVGLIDRRLLKQVLHLLIGLVLVRQLLGGDHLGLGGRRDWERFVSGAIDLATGFLLVLDGTDEVEQVLLGQDKPLLSRLLVVVFRGTLWGVDDFDAGASLHRRLRACTDLACLQCLLEILSGPAGALHRFFCVHVWRNLRC